MGQHERWEAWIAKVKEVIAKGPGKKVAILELGAGGRVPTVRKNSEKQLGAFTELGADARLIRVNPELPCGDDDWCKPGSASEHLIISIMGCALDVVKRMDAAMP